MKIAAYFFCSELCVNWHETYNTVTSTLLYQNNFFTDVNGEWDGFSQAKVAKYSKFNFGAAF